jgi:hypothetical protein
MTEDAIKQRRAYQRKYRATHKETINQRQKEWRNANKDKVKEYNKTYWEKLAEKLKETTA